MSEIEFYDDFLLIKCPNCSGVVQVHKSETNCCIFRHGIYRNNFTQVNPHASQAQCESLIKSKQVYGCCLPFQLLKTTNNKSIISVQKCGFI